MNTSTKLLHSLLRAQAGVASVTQANAAGLTVGQIDRLVKRGDLASIHPNVFRSTAAPPSWEADLIAGVLFLGPRALPSHETAARLQGLSPFEASPRIEFVAFPEHRGVGGPLHVHITRRLDKLDVTAVTRSLPAEARSDTALIKIGLLTEIRCTSASRTVIDLAGRVRSSVLGDLVDSAIQRKLSSAEFLAKRLTELRGSGVSGCRALAEMMLDAGGHSRLERRFLQLMREAGLPRPQCQIRFRHDGITVARVDFFFEGTRLIVEVSGRRGHVSDDDRLKDARRRNELQQAGYHVVEFVTSQVIGTPAYVVKTVKEALSGQPSTLLRTF